ncbi:MAG: hypothetical protein HRT94_03825 [Alphaproteobacteria bacterium]|nr:hypothetical protein [Alphaproteobacteria bacterium]
MRLLQTLTGIVTSAFMATSAMAKEEELQPYRCAETANTSILTSWQASEARATLIDNGGSAARIARGKTYAAFMDSFWSNLEERFSENSPNTVEELFDGIGESYQEAYSTSAGASLKHGVTPQLFLDSSFRNRTDSGDLNDNDIVLAPSDLETTSLFQNEQLQDLLPLDGTLDDGIDISIRFMPSWGDYVHMPIASGLGQHVSLSKDDGIEVLLGFTKPRDFVSNSYWDEINVKDNVICPNFY